MVDRTLIAETDKAPQVELVDAAAKDMPVLANLLELYAHDFSEFHAVRIGADGRFGYAQLPLYWTEADRHAFLVRVNGDLAGFVLVKKGSEISGDETAWDMVEFFVARGYRRRGIGSQIAHKVWGKLHGHWEVRVMKSNRGARQFWKRAIGEYSKQEIRPAEMERNGTVWEVFRFQSS
jgi:predicted acetyltransferase